MKEKTVKTVSGAEHLETRCRLIDGVYYLIGDNKIENSGDVYLINNRYIRFSTDRIVYDHFEQEYKLKNSSLVNGIIGIKDEGVLFGYFSKNDLYNVRVITKDLSEKIAISSNVLGYMFRERRSDGVFYHISLLEAGKFNQLRAISREIKESFPYDSKGSIAKVTKNFETYYKPVICRNADIIGASFKGYTFGLEFETNAGIIPNTKLNYLPLIPLRDGSISGIEYATIPLQGPTGVQALIDSVDELRRRTSFNDECSLHIHVGGMPRTIEFILAFYKTISLIQNDIFAMFPLYKKYNFGIKRKNYSAPFPFEEINFKMDPVINYTDKKALIKNFEPLFYYLSGGMSFAEYNNDLNQVAVHPQDPQGNAKWNIKHRYSFVNLIPLIFGNHQTIEFRIHTPTYDINKIMNFLMINIYIIDFVQINYKKILAGNVNIALRRPTVVTLLEEYVNNLPDNGRKMIFNELINYISERKHATENITREKGVVYQESELNVPKSIKFNTYEYYKKIIAIEGESAYSYFDPFYDEAPKGEVKFRWSNPFENPLEKLEIKAQPSGVEKLRMAKERAVREKSRLKAKEDTNPFSFNVGPQTSTSSMGPGLYDQLRVDSQMRKDYASAIERAESALSQYRKTGSISADDLIIGTPGEPGLNLADLKITPSTDSKEKADWEAMGDYDWDVVKEDEKPKQ